MRAEEGPVDVVDDRERIAVGHELEDPRADRMRAGEHQRLAAAFSESGDAPFVEPDRREAIVRRRLAEREDGQGIALASRAHERLEVRRLQGVAVDEKELVVAFEQTPDV